MELPTALSLAFIPVVLVSVGLQVYDGLETPAKPATMAVEGISMLQQQSIVKRGNRSEAAQGLISVWGVDGCTRERDTKPIDHPAQELKLTRKAAVRCCQNGRGQLVCVSSFVGCHREKTYAEAKAICEGKQLRLCSKDELESNVCCGTGCGFDNWLTWTSTPYGKPLPTKLTTEEEEDVEKDLKEEVEDTFKTEKEEEPKSNLGGFRYAMKKVVDDVISPLKDEVAGLETKITAIATKKQSEAGEALQELTKDLGDVSAALTEAEKSRKAAHDKVIAAADGVKNIKASLGADLAKVISSEDLKKAEASITAAVEETKKEASADKGKAAKAIKTNHRYLKAIYKDLHHFPGS